MGGRKIDDHKSWLGSGKGEMPAECKVMKFDDSKGAGELSRYEDTEERIRAQQDMGVRKIKGHDQPSDERN
jgi:hypothetical protein